MFRLYSVNNTNYFSLLLSLNISHIRLFCSLPCTLILVREIHLLTYLLTYLLTPWCRVLLEKLTDLQVVKKLPALHGTRRFITALTSLRHLSLSWASPIRAVFDRPVKFVPHFWVCRYRPTDPYVPASVQCTDL